MLEENYNLGKRQGTYYQAKETDMGGTADCVLTFLKEYNSIIQLQHYQKILIYIYGIEPREHTHSFSLEQWFSTS